MMRLVPLILGAGIAFSAPALAQTDLLRVEGLYERVQPPQPTETPGKVEVLDVFWFGCPHCFRFLPLMERYEKTKPDHVALRRMPAVFRDSWITHAKAYYTARLLGVEAQIHRPMFEAIHVHKRPMQDREELAGFFAGFGVSREDFEQTFDSFAVQSLVRKSEVMQERYGVRGTPTVIINGKYRTSGGVAGSFENVLKVIEALVDKEHRANLAAR